MTNILLKFIIKIPFFIASMVLLWTITVLSAEASTLSVSPNTGVYSLGQNFTVSIVINTQGKSINAAEGTLRFNPSELSVVSLNKGSLFNLWTTEPSFSNTAGTVTFSGGTPAGYSGATGVVLNVTFRSNKAGTARLSFTDGSVLAADGMGTNVLNNMTGGTYTITVASESPEPEVVVEYVPPANTPSAPVVRSDTHPDPDLWYKETTARLSWSVPSGVTAVRTLLDKKPTSVPTNVHDTPISEITLEGLDDGVSYFHIQFRNADGWGRVTHYRLAVDSKKPTSFSIDLLEGSDSASPIQTLVLNAENEVSQVNRYLVQVNGGEPYEFIDREGNGILELAPLDPGYHSVIIEAFNEAGNSLIATFSFVIEAFERPVFIEYPNTLSGEVIPVIKGMTRPNSEVTVTIRKLGLGSSEKFAEKEYLVKSDEDGLFIFIPDGRLDYGVYELVAVSVDEYGARSEVSDPVRMVVEQPGLLRIGSLVLNVLSVMVPLFALLLLSIILSIMTWRRVKTLRVGVKREAHEALVIAVNEFDRLESLLSKEREKLIKQHKNGKLTKTETELMAEMKRALSDAKRKVRKEISDVEDIVE